MATSILSSPILLPKFLHRPRLPSKPSSKAFPSPPPSFRIDKILRSGRRSLTPTNTYSTTTTVGEVATTTEEGELVFFDGGSHYGDLVANLLLGFTLLWLPLTLAAVSRAFFLRYRFTNRRATVVSGFTGGDRTDFPYSAVSDVKVVPRLIGEWGDIVITLKDGTKVDLRSVPKFREVADYCLLMAKDAETRPGEQQQRSRRGF
ncbi:uncharacterized protein M6B38_313005 [Iris pallida]|uniref:YdbS-like PH domain-containing protein n=1 Tax=Iris pallida TaxID=29817 RepID=A0AAX6HI78_IRIPA|nr:uncharacterized protein M6B38_313005 [Iris pallida]